MITGATGFVGGHLLQYLLDHTDWEFVCTRRQRLPMWIREDKRTFSQVTWIPCDLETDDLTHERLVHLEVDLIFSIASWADPVAASTRPRDCIRANAAIMTGVCQLAKQYGAPIIHLSTNEVYGANSLGAREDAPLTPNSPYGTSKAIQEMILQSLWPKSLIVNTQSLFGERQQPDRLIPRAVGAILRDEEIPIQGEPFLGDDWRSSARPYLHARRLASVLLDLAVAGGWGGKKHVVGQVTSTDTVVGVIGGLLRRFPRYLRVPTGDRPGHELDTTIAQSIKAHPGRAEWMADLSRTVEWFRLRL
jgi:nucleoside-diphosphate-sugar epimerase